MLRDFPLPDGTEEQVTAWLADPEPAVATPRLAATVVLVRDGDPGLEVFLMRRRTSMAFAGGMYAFPGGGVDPRDAEADLPWAGPDAATWAADLGCSPEQARAFVCAAVRETFEECGVLLAGEADGGLCDVAGPQWEDERQALLSRDQALSELLVRRGLTLRSDLLRAWAHWTTPVHEPRRYDTRFLVAVLPAGQQARHVDGEADQSGWWDAAEVVALAGGGEVRMLPPTLVTLEEVAAAPDAATLWSSPRRVREVMPELVRRDGALVLTTELPDQPGAPGERA